MNICVDCKFCRDINGDTVYWCFRDGDENGVDCRSKNLDGKCSEYEKRNPMSPAVNDEVKAALLTLAADREKLLEARDAAQAKVDENMAAIETLLPGKLGSSRSSKLSEGLKVKVTRGINYKVDHEKVRELGLPYPPLKLKTEVKLDEKGYKWYEANDKDTFNKIAKHVTATPAKISIELIKPKAK